MHGDGVCLYKPAQEGLVFDMVLTQWTYNGRKMHLGFDLAKEVFALDTEGIAVLNTESTVAQVSHQRRERRTGSVWKWRQICKRK